MLRTLKGSERQKLLDYAEGLKLQANALYETLQYLNFETRIIVAASYNIVEASKEERCKHSSTITGGIQTFINKHWRSS